MQVLHGEQHREAPLGTPRAQRALISATLSSMTTTTLSTIARRACRRTHARRGVVLEHDVVDARAKRAGHGGNACARSCGGWRRLLEKRSMAWIGSFRRCNTLDCHLPARRPARGYAVGIATSRMEAMRSGGHLTMSHQAGGLLCPACRVPRDERSGAAWSSTTAHSAAACGSIADASSTRSSSGVPPRSASLREPAQRLPARAVATRRTTPTSTRVRTW